MTKVLGESELLTVWEVTASNHCLVQGSTVFYRMFLYLDLSDIFSFSVEIMCYWEGYHRGDNTIPRASDQELFGADAYYW